MTGSPGSTTGQPAGSWTRTSSQPRGYLLGSSEEETARLIRQGELFGPLTRRLFVEAGIGPGMRVLDLGSGAGDVAFLAAELVGPTGEVVSIDRDPKVLAVARDRARAMGLRNVSFIEGELGGTPPPGRFDALVGRLILMYLPDRVAVIRGLLPSLRPGAVVAFHEMDFLTTIAIPPVPVLARTLTWWLATLRRVGIEERMGPKLHQTLIAAGLPRPTMMAEAIISGPEDSPTPDMWANVIRSALPVMTRLGIATEAEVEVETLAGRIWAEAVAAGSCLSSPLLVGAWSRVP